MNLSDRPLFPLRFLGAALLGMALECIGLPLPAIAQITPDASLGSEGSTVRRNVSTPRGMGDRIEGGALRGSNLFHSFSEFNIGRGQSVYFANPRSVANIFSRITGLSRSEINGTLGVLGSANLFLINPNGIIFGPDAQLDVRGSFFASTGDRLVFNNGYQFSATNPDAPPLMTLNLAPGLNSWLPNAGAIANQGNLSAGRNLTLTAANLELEGQLRAGNNLTLTANTLTAQDSASSPFIASARNRLLFQGNQSLSLDALNHRASGLVSGGDMVLRSDNPINLDTRFRVGGNFRSEQLDGGLSRGVSLRDPVFEVRGNFSLAEYSGASLQILAGGSVSIPGTVIIDAPGVPFNDSTVILSNGTRLVISGTTQPTLDIRAGTTGFFNPPAPGTPTSANISIGSIRTTGGLVFLTNQFRPNDLGGNITVGEIDTSDFAGGGRVVMDSRGRIRFNFINTSSGDIEGAIAILGGAALFGGTLDAADFGGAGGDVTLLAANNIVMPLPSYILSYGLSGGNITLNSRTAILQNRAPFGTGTGDLSTIESGTFGNAQGGSIRFNAPQLSFGGNVVASTYAEGATGEIRLSGGALSTNQSSILTITFGSGEAGDFRIIADAIALDYSFLGSSNQSLEGARSGDIFVKTGTLSSLRGGQISSQTLGIGDAGNITVIAQDISLSGFQPAALTGGVFAPSAIFSTAQPGAEGNSGRVNISTGTLTLTNGASVNTSSFGNGDAGDVTVTASRGIRVDGAIFFPLQPDQTPLNTSASSIASELFTDAVGSGGNITINTPVLQVLNGGTITALSDGAGDAGDITITATQSALFDGVASFAAQRQRDRISRAAVIADQNATGDGGILTINTPSLTLSNGAQLTAETNGAGDAGNIVLNVTDQLNVRNAGTGILANTGAQSTGNGGGIVIRNPNQIRIQDGARIAVNSQGSGTAGGIEMRSRQLLLNRGTISAETTSNTGGNVTVNADEVVVMQNNSRISTTAGTAQAGGDGGNLVISTPFLVAVENENNDITANAFTGRGGRVEISASAIFGFTVRSRDDLIAALGTSNPNLLDPAALITNDITAISQTNPSLSGEVVLRTPDANPATAAITLPTEVVDLSNLIARGCAATGEVGRTQGSFTVTGRGGLQPTPDGQLRSSTPLVGWEAEVPSVAGNRQNPNPGETLTSTAVPPVQAPSGRTQLIEVQSLMRRADGQIVLAALPTDIATHSAGIAIACPVAPNGIADLNHDF